METNELKDFAQDLMQEVLARSDAADEGSMRSEMLTEVMLEYLFECEEVINAQAIPFEVKGANCNGYALSEDNDRLDLFITLAHLDGLAGTVPKSNVQQAFDRLKNFLAKAFGDFTKPKRNPPTAGICSRRSIAQKRSLVRLDCSF